MHLMLKAYGLETHLFLPHRMEEGYGVSRDGITRVFEEFGKPNLFVALDCGTTSLNEMRALKEVGVVGFAAVVIFLAILVVGFVYEWKKGALDWE